MARPLADYQGVHTYKNTPFAQWYAEANHEFEQLGHSAPSIDDARDAYDMGESPGTFASYVANT